MEESRSYLTHKSSDDRWKELCNKALQYALISIPFTINRMGIKAIERRVFNILKGKLSELLFSDFTSKAGLDVNFKDCTTPFHQVDRRDFLWKECEWDLKNNFLTTKELGLKSHHIDHLPGLIPSNFKGDQWDKKERRFFDNTKESRVIFSFMIGKLETGPLVTEWAQLRFSQDQKKWLHQLNEQYLGKPQTLAPFTKDWFWSQWEQLSMPWEKTLEVNFNSPLFITSYAGTEQWDLFKEVPPRSFSGGMFKTRINNRACALKHLPAFSQLMASER